MFDSTTHAWSGVLLSGGAGDDVSGTSSVIYHIATHQSGKELVSLLRTLV